LIGRAFLGVALLALPSCSRQSPSTWTEPFTGMEFVLVAAGDFVMGSPDSEVGREPQETLHRVVISRPFYLGRTEVTQVQWRRVMGSNPSHFQDCGDACPVETVNWFEAHEFVVRLERLTGQAFRLPTEAEWEYACRAGTSTPFHTGPNLTAEQANYAGHFPYPGFPPGVFRGRPTPVGRFSPNAWGFSDLHGNIWEWCADEHCPYDPATATDPLGHCGSGVKVIRGGSWAFDANSARCALRYTHAPADRGFSLGVRLVRPIPS
jgi:formylglycine-generating enzyme required for sulfatase activity